MSNIKIAAIGNYVPRQCGIATFTRDLVESIVGNRVKKNVNARAYVLAMNDHPQTYVYPSIVQYSIRQEHQRDYVKAAKYITYSQANICLLQHEFGIFGGDDGSYVLTLLDRLRIPLVVTFHTVLKNPSDNQKRVIQAIGKKASKMVVMSKLAVEFLKDIYKIRAGKIALIEHGVPDIQSSGLFYKNKLNLEGKKSVFTFGLLSKDKGIETVLKALPKVVSKHPDLVYIVLGKTHPNILRASGEEYRNQLKLMVEKLGLVKHIYFDNRYVTNEELFEYLYNIDIYITPYLNEAQITSGTLAYAVGAGAAVVSTPYWHAKELLADNRGRLFDFNDYDGLSKILLDLFDHPLKLQKIKKLAHEYGKKTTWPEIGSQYIELISGILKRKNQVSKKQDHIINPDILPHFDLEHIQRLTDNTGIIQHANYIVADLKHGYALDDNARALLMSLMAHHQKKDKITQNLIATYMSFVMFMQNGDGTFRNLLGINKEFLDERGSEDSFGRTIWALGYLFQYPPSKAYFHLGRKLFDSARPHFSQLRSPRGIATTIIGISHFLQRFEEESELKKVITVLGKKLLKLYDQFSQEGWEWFEPILTYDNGIIPLSLFHAHETTGNKQFLDIAKKSMEFLEKINLGDGHLSLIGSNGWYKKGGVRARFAQQPLDAMAMVLLFHKAFVVFKEKEYLKKMIISFKWFLGENDFGLPLFNFETRGCGDGLEEEGININQGAESTIAYQISHLTVLKAHEEEARGT